MTVRLASDYDEMQGVGARHGIEISATRVSKVVKHFAGSASRRPAGGAILEQTRGTLLRQSASD